MNLEAIAFTGDEENVGGVIHSEVYLIDRASLDTIEQPPDMDADVPPASFDELMTIATAHVPAVGSGFLKVEAIPKTGNVESTLVGEEGGKAWQNNFAFHVKGNSAKALGLARWAKDRDIIALVKEVGGQIRQIGGKEIPARLLESTATLGGGGHDGKKHVAFTLQDFQKYPAPIYGAAIPEPA